MNTQKQIQDLKDQAVYAGLIKLPKKPWESWDRSRVLTELKYYFDKNMNELGYVTFENSSFAAVQLFETPRVWDKGILGSLAVHKLRPNCH